MTLPEKRVRRHRGVHCTRHARATEVMNLLVEKMPEYTSPYGIQIGYQIADLFDVLVLPSDKKPSDQAPAIAKHEIDLYKQYMLYIQSLSPAKFQSLTRVDRYIFDTYFMQLVQLYVSLGSDPEETIKELAVRVSISTVTTAITTKDNPCQVDEKVASISFKPSAHRATAAVVPYPLSRGHMAHQRKKRRTVYLDFRRRPHPGDYSIGF